MILATALLPHGVEDGSVLHDAEQLVGGGHVVRDRPLAVAEKRVWRPDLADHEVVESKDLDGALEFQALVDPRLPEEHVHGVFLERTSRMFTLNYDDFHHAATLLT